MLIRSVMPCLRLHYAFVSYLIFAQVISGVLHGSVFRPSLFLMFINHLNDPFDGTVNVKLYADDN